MNTQHLIYPERFSAEYRLDSAKVDSAIKAATEKLASKIDIYINSFPENICENYKYIPTRNVNWQSGMHTGTFALAYELTGDEKFLDVVKAHMPTYRERVDNDCGMGDHDVGFSFSPSCVAMYKLTGDEYARKIALDAAEIFYNRSYSKEGGFIIRMACRLPQEWAYRTMVDSMLNIPLLYWASQETGDPKYAEAAKSQVHINMKYLTRSDGSTYHHYQFDVESHKPVHGVTLQGNRDESCWTRGHAWCTLGYPIAYSYTGNKTYMDAHRENVYYMLTHMPQDNLLYWDYDFTDGSDEPRDGSANAIAVCGMLEALRHIDPNSTEYKVYRNASAMMLEALIDKCTGDIGVDYDGLICHVTAAKPANLGVDQCALYGDYFYLEALKRYTDPDWKQYW